QTLPVDLAGPPDPEGRLEPVALVSQFGKGMVLAAEAVLPSIAPHRLVEGRVEAREVCQQTCRKVGECRQVGQAVDRDFEIVTAPALLEGSPGRGDPLRYVGRPGRLKTDLLPEGGQQGRVKGRA